MNSHADIITPQVLYCCEGILAVHKPAGLLSVPGRGEDKADCVIARVHVTHPQALIVHRLDQATSGILVMALNSAMHRELSMRFAAREIDKTYEAIVHGNVMDSEGRIDLPLIADCPNRPRQKVDHSIGKPSVTDWSVMERSADRTRLRLKPVTGRSHQLRVHLMSIGHPIVGDGLYGPPGDDVQRLMLHACAVDFDHPITGERTEILSPAPF